MKTQFHYIPEDWTSCHPTNKHWIFLPAANHRAPIKFSHKHSSLTKTQILQLSSIQTNNWTKTNRNSLTKFLGLCNELFSFSPCKVRSSFSIFDVHLNFLLKFMQFSFLKGHLVKSVFHSHLLWQQKREIPQTLQLTGLITLYSN